MVNYLLRLPENSKNSVHIIYGPTASGKSARAIELAQQADAVILNADATQLYRELRILSARPSAEDEEQASHAFYGILQGNKPASAAWWASEIAKEIRNLWEKGKLPILCGGTGMYLSVLQQGISPIPSVETSTRDKVSEYSNAALMKLLKQHDPKAANRLKEGDTQRLRRAAEVWMETGKALSDWQAAPKTSFLPEASWQWEIINPVRELLYERVNLRFLRMMQEGGVEEVKALLAINYPETAPVMKAVGVPEIRAYLEGKITREEAIAKAQQHSRNYAKRQVTWLKNQLSYLA